MSNWNLGTVEEVNSGSAYVRVEPGYQNLTITGVENTVAGTGSKGLKITFKSDKGGEFSQNFYLIAPDGSQSKQAPAFKYLYDNFTEEVLPENFTTESISAKLIGKTTDATVGGRKYTTAREEDAIVNGEATKVVKKYDNIAAELPFGGWKGERQIRFSGQWESEVSVNNTVDSKEVTGAPW